MHFATIRASLTGVEESRAKAILRQASGELRADESKSKITA